MSQGKRSASPLPFAGPGSLPTIASSGGAVVSFRTMPLLPRAWRAGEGDLLFSLSSGPPSPFRSVPGRRFLVDAGSYRDCDGRPRMQKRAPFAVDRRRLFESVFLFNII